VTNLLMCGVTAFLALAVITSRAERMPCSARKTWHPLTWMPVVRASPPAGA